jgi:hypothetical protein
MKGMFFFIILAVVVLFLAMCFQAGAQMPCPSYTDQQLANSIYWAEGGAKTKHPYGILAKYKHTTPRQACLNTIRSAVKRFEKQTAEKDFIHFLSLTYCPIGVANDPTGLNVNWERNVKYFLGKEVLR